MELKAVHTDIFFLESVSRDASGAEWKTGISCPDLHITLKCLRTYVRAATEGRAMSGQGQARVPRVRVARPPTCTRVCWEVAAESEVPLVT